MILAILGLVFVSTYLVRFAASASGLADSTPLGPRTTLIRPADGVRYTISTDSAGTTYYIIEEEEIEIATAGAVIIVSPTPVPVRARTFFPLRIDLPEGFFTNVSDLINGVLRFVIIIAALLTFVYLIWASIDWITSGGESGKVAQARGKITSAIIGLIVVAASYAILLVVLNFLGYESLEAVFDEFYYRTPR